MANEASPPAQTGASATTCSITRATTSNSNNPSGMLEGGNNNVIIRNSTHSRIAREMGFGDFCFGRRAKIYPKIDGPEAEQVYKKYTDKDWLASRSNNAPERLFGSFTRRDFSYRRICIQLTLSCLGVDRFLSSSSRLKSAT